MNNPEMISDLKKYEAFIKSLRSELEDLLRLSSEELETRAINKSILDDLILKLHIPDVGIETTSPEADKRLLELMGVDLIEDMKGSLQPIVRKAGKERTIRQITKVDLLTKAKILEKCLNLTDEQVFAFALGFSMAKLSEINDNLDLREHHAKIEASNHAKKNYSGDMREFFEKVVEVYVEQGFAERSFEHEVKFKIPHWKRIVAFLKDDVVMDNNSYTDWKQDGNLGAIYRESATGKLRKIKGETMRRHIELFMKKYNKSMT